MRRKDANKYNSIELNYGINYLELLDKLDEMKTSLDTMTEMNISWKLVADELRKQLDIAEAMHIDNVTKPLDQASEVKLVRLKGGQTDNPDQLVKSFITVNLDGKLYEGEGHTIANIFKDVLIKIAEDQS